MCDTPMRVWLMRRFHPPPEELDEVVFPDVLVLLERRSSSALQLEIVVIIAAMCSPTPAQSSHHLPEEGIMAVCLPRLPLVVEAPSKDEPPDTVLIVQLDIASDTDARGICAMSTEHDGMIDMELEGASVEAVGATGADFGTVADFGSMDELLTAVMLIERSGAGAVDGVVEVELVVLVLAVVVVGVTGCSMGTSAMERLEILASLVSTLPAASIMLEFVSGVDRSSFS